MFKFDIHSAYHFVDIYMPHTEYLGFSWLMNGQRVYYKFLVLPFGLSTAPYIFTKITRPLIGKWRGEGKLIIMFLDDGFGCNSSMSLTKVASEEIKSDLLKSGFIPKAEKSMWFPIQELEFLGVCFNTIDGLLSIPARRVDKALCALDELERCIHTCKRVQVRRVASFVGQIISMNVVIGNVSKIMTRYLSMDVHTAYSWNSYIRLSDMSMEQLSFWKCSLKALNVRRLHDTGACSKIVYSDASNTGFAGYEVNTVDSVSHGMWNLEESLKSSTWRELVAVWRVLNSLKGQLTNHRLKWFSDNSGVCRIVHKGSMKGELQDVAMKIYRACISSNISIEMEWVPRTLNERADYLSRIIDRDDWGISFELLELIEQKWGSLQVDWFASDHNAKNPSFYSRFWNQNCTGVDAFTVNWTGKFGLFVPPVFLIPRVLRQMMRTQASGVLVAPMWRTASFWPLICNGGKENTFIRNVEDCIELPTQKEYYVPCRNGSGIFGVEDLKFKMLAMKLVF